MTLRGQPGLAGERHGMWRGGRVNVGGYVGIHMPGHPRANHTGYVLEHLLIAERALGRPIPEVHPVHHVDENKSNNAPTNLVICQDKAYHNLLHRRLRALKACGDANAHRCCFCGKYDNQHDISVANLRNGDFCAYHRACNSARYHKRKRRLQEQSS